MQITKHMAQVLMTDQNQEFLESSLKYAFYTTLITKHP